LRIAVISDLHAGSPYIDTAKIDAVVALTNAARPDLVLLAGDYVIDRMVGGHHMAITEIAAHLKPLHARLGVYAVLGNHDHREGGERVTAAFETLGIAVLSNRNLTLHGPHGPIVLAGIDDYVTHHSDPHAALAGVTGNALCFTHSPDVFPYLPAGCGFTVAGHTHGGQVWLPLVGRIALDFLSPNHQRYGAGVVREDGKTMFVSTGIGTTGLPVRFMVPPEISLLTIP
jgi:predicted MPP superfamily phosphohydrolase